MGKRIVLLIGLCAGWAALAEAQRPSAAGAKAAPVVIDPVAGDLLATNPSSATDILRVLESLIDLGQAKAGQGLLAKLTALPLTDDQLADLDRQLGSGIFLKLSLAADLQPAGKQFADRVLATARKQARDPAHIAELIGRLKSPSINDRAATIAELLRGGDVAVSALVKVLADTQSAEDRQAASDALVVLGGLSIGALAAALDGDRADLAVRAATILGYIGTANARQWLLAPALGQQRSAAVRAAAQRAIAAISGNLPSRAEAAAELYNTALEFDQQPPALPEQPGGLVTLWTWDAKTQLPAATQLAARLATRELAARLAAAGREILPDELQLRRLQNVLLLEAAIARAGGLAKLDRQPGSPWDQIAAEGLPAVEDLLEFAAGHDHPGPAAVAAEILGARGGEGLLVSEDGQPRALARAAAHPDRRLRFAAAAAVIAIDPQEAYPGSSLVADAMKFFLGSHGARVAVVGDIRPVGAQQLAGLLQPLGFDVRVATSDRELVREAINAPDLELVLVDMLLAGELSGKVVQDLRRDCRTGHVPVGLVAATWELNRAGMIARREARTAAMLRPLNVGTAQAIVATLGQLAPEQVPPAERLAQCRQALAWLASRSPASRVELYPLVHFEAELVAAAQLPSLVDAAVPLLAELGTPACQRALVELASAPVGSLPLRKAAAAAFGKNVMQHGILLTQTQIVQQYNLYNASQQQDRQTQAVLATILDAMEEHAARQAARGPVR